MLSQYNHYYQLFKHSTKPWVNNTQLTTTPMSPKPITRTLRISAGRSKQPIEQTMPSATHDEPQQIQSDTSGYHGIVATHACHEPQCHQRLCDTIHRDICPYPPGSSVLVTEVGGGLTHNPPKNKDSVQLDSHDTNGKPKPQYLVKEKTAVPMDMENFKENEKMTEYVQQESIATIIRDHAAINSVISLKNTSFTDTPYDENL